MSIDSIFESIVRWDDEPVEPITIVLLDTELNLPEWEFELEIGDGMPTASNGFPPSEWV